MAQSAKRPENTAYIELMKSLEKMRAEKPKDLMAAGNKLVQRFLDAGLKRLKTKED